jgi:hypothetical protein
MGFVVILICKELSLGSGLRLNRICLSVEPVSKRPILANLCVGLKFQSSIPMESGLTVEIFARLDLDQTESF